MSNRDLTSFEAASEEKLTWDKRAQMILSQFGAVEGLVWNKAFQTDVDLFARLVKDILKLDQAQPGRPGPRPALDYEQGVTRLKQYMGEDYALEAFPEALKYLSNGRSIRAVARRADLSKNHVHRLLTGEVAPDAYAMKQIAEAFGKHPSYFLEWRAMWVANAIVEQMIKQPETSIAVFQKFRSR